MRRGLSYVVTGIGSITYFFFLLIKHNPVGLIPVLILMLPAISGMSLYLYGLSIGLKGKPLVRSKSNVEVKTELKKFYKGITDKQAWKTYIKHRLRMPSTYLSVVLWATFISLVYEEVQGFNSVDAFWKANNNLAPVLTLTQLEQVVLVPMIILIPIIPLGIWYFIYSRYQSLSSERKVHYLEKRIVVLESKLNSLSPKTEELNTSTSNRLP